MSEVKHTFNGLPVRDARMALIITVTKRDISKNKKHAPDSCAAAHALCRQEGVKEAWVYLTRTYVRENGHYVRYATPAALRTEVAIIDRGGQMEPGDYRLLMPPKHHSGSRNAHKPTGRKRPRHVLEGVRSRAP